MTNLMDVELVWTIAGIVVSLVESSKAFAVSIAPGTLGDKVIDWQHPGVVSVDFSIIFASNPSFHLKLFLCYSTAHLLC